MTEEKVARPVHDLRGGGGGGGVGQHLGVAAGRGRGGGGSEGRGVRADEGEVLVDVVLHDPRKPRPRVLRGRGGESVRQQSRQMLAIQQCSHMWRHAQQHSGRGGGGGQHAPG